jgi:hypothetical protein
LYRNTIIMASNVGAREIAQGTPIGFSGADSKRSLSNAIPFWVEHPELSFYDSYLVWAAELADKTPYWTFDKKLAAQSSTAQLIKP